MFVLTRHFPQFDLNENLSRDDIVIRLVSQLLLPIERIEIDVAGSPAEHRLLDTPSRISKQTIFTNIA